MSFESDLDFLYNKADAELGIKSNCIESFSGNIYVPILPYFGFASYKGIAPFTPKQIRACRKLIIIKQKLNKLPAKDRRMLDALFNNEYNFPPELHLLGKHYPLALFYPTFNVEDNGNCRDNLLKLIEISSKKADNIHKAHIRIYIQQQYDRLKAAWK